MKVLVSRTTHTAKGEVTLDVLMGDSIDLSGMNAGVHGHFVEVRMTSDTDHVITQRVLWRELFTDIVPIRQANWFSDVTLDMKARDIFLCLGSNDRFGIYVISLDSKPRMALPTRLPLSPKESDELLRVALLGSDRIRPIVPPNQIWLQIPNILAASLQKMDDDLQITVTRAKEVPPLMLHYSLTKELWTVNSK